MDTPPFFDVMKQYDNKTLSAKLLIVNKYKTAYPQLKYIWISTAAKYLANINDIEIRKKYNNLIIGLILD